MKHSRVLTIACVLLLAGSAGATVWTVDDSGGADYTTIQAAIDGAASGDAILVFPGTYAAFTVTGKTLSILGAPVIGGGNPFVTGTSTVQSAQDATVAGLDFRALVLDGISGTAILDDVSTDPTACVPGLRILDCVRVLVMRGDFEGKQGDINCETEAVFVDNSVASLSSCVLRGGEGGSDGCNGFDGQPGLRLGTTARVILADSSSFGGDGGSGLFDCGFGGDGAPAIRYSGAGSTCIVRGNTNDILDGGSQGCALTCGTSAQYVADGTGVLVISGVTATPSTFGPSISGSIPVPAQPFSTLTGNDLPGSTKTFSIYGPNGSNNLVYVTFGWPDAYSFPPVEGSMLLGFPGPILSFVIPGAGQNTPAGFSFNLEPSFAGIHGVIVTFQSATQNLGAGGKWLAHNPFSLVIR